MPAADRSSRWRRRTRGWACRRGVHHRRLHPPLDQDWLNYQHEIGLRHTRTKKNVTDHADSLDHIPLRYLLAFTAVVIATSRDYLAAAGASPEQVDRMHAAFTKSVMLHVTVWTRPYVDAADW
ncbi:MAG TPA: protoglobin domain-containing protein [Actinoallomurus sp.]|nr:protoglobin domain-containing protein [Actinoallomurus sp.]